MRARRGWIKVYPPGAFRGRDGWHFRGRDLYGRPIEGKFPPEVHQQGAAERGARRILDAANRRPAPPLEPPAPAPDHSFKAAAEAWRRHRRPGKAEWARVERLVAWKEIGLIDVGRLNTDSIAVFCTETMKGRKASTLNREAVAPFAAVMHHACDLDWRPYIRIRRFAEQEPENVAATPKDFELLEANADATSTYEKGARGRNDKLVAYKVALLELIRLRGMRISDTCRLKRAEDLDLPRARIRLTIGKARDKVIWLPLSDSLVAAFANLKPCDGVYVFPWRTKSGVYKWLVPLRDRLKLKFTPHMARHALGEEMIDAGVDLITIRTAGGWASLNSVRRYARASAKRLREADRLREIEAKKEGKG
jgi:site-specific recombinase XerC